MNKSLETRKVIADFLEFANNLGNLENETEYYYWMTEAIIHASESLKQIESQEEEQ